MANFVKRNARMRALIRKHGQTLCATFPNKTQAKAWADAQERRLDQIRATGAIQDKTITIADLIDWYIKELAEKKNWGRTKSADLARLRKDIGAHRAASITTAWIVDYFRRRQSEGSGPVVIAGQAGYLHAVFKAARDLRHLDLPIAAVAQALESLRQHEIAGHSDERDRRVSDAEISALIEYFEAGNSPSPAS